MLGDRRLAARTGLALVMANARYWPTVWPKVQAQLHRWERRAREIEDPGLRTLALEKLHHERFNAEVAATLATLAPRAQRGNAVEAIVALELLFDYLDGITEQPTENPLLDGDTLFGAMRDAIDLHAGEDASDYFRHHPGEGDGGYLRDLSSATRAALARLPAAAAVGEVAEHAAARCGEAQIHKHAAASLGVEQLETWAREDAVDTPLQWRELIAGAASSVLAVHALIAAAADPATSQQDASALAEAYLLIGALITALDGLVDHNNDMAVGEPGFLALYEDQAEVKRALLDVMRKAIAKTSGVKDNAHHLMTLVGVVAYYTSSPGARAEAARPVARALQGQLRPLITPTLAVMRAWRLAKRASERARLTGEQTGSND